MAYQSKVRRDEWERTICPNIFDRPRHVSEVGKWSLIHAKTLEVYYVMCPACYEFVADMIKRNSDYRIVPVGKGEDDGNSLMVERRDSVSSM